MSVALENYGGTYDVKDVQGRKDAENGDGFFKSRNFLRCTRVGKTMAQFGIEYVFNADGSVTVNGTNPSSTSWAWLTLTSKHFHIPKGKYILSGCPEGGASNKFYLKFRRDPMGGVDVNDTGSGVTVNVTEEDQVYNCWIGIAPNATLENATFWPMLRLFDDADDTFDFYQDMPLKDQIENASLRKNLCPTKYTFNPGISNGITYTMDENGVITANGTATADGGTWVFFSPEKYDKEYLNFKPGKRYILSGCPDGALLDSSTFRFYIIWKQGGSGWSGQVYDWGGEVWFTLPANVSDWGLFIWFKTGYVAENLQFKPMIRDYGVYDQDYIPYTPDTTMLDNYKLNKSIVCNYNGISDANQLVKDGIYSGRDLANQPTTGWVNYQVIQTDKNANYVTQIATSPTSSRTYTRFCADGVWSGWRALINYQDDIVNTTGGFDRVPVYNAASSGASASPSYGNSCWVEAPAGATYLVVVGVFGMSVITVPYIIAFAGGQTSGLGTVRTIKEEILNSESAATQQRKIKITHNFKHIDEETDDKNVICIHATVVDGNNNPIKNVGYFINMHAIQLFVRYSPDRVEMVEELPS